MVDHEENWKKLRDLGAPMKSIDTKYSHIYVVSFTFYGHNKWPTAITNHEKV